MEEMIEVCAGLVDHNKEDDTVRLVHYTIQEYLERTKERWFRGAEIEITEVCLTCLLFDVSVAGACLTDEELEARLQNCPLYDYAARNWGCHLFHGDPDLSSTQELILKFVESEQKVAAKDSNGQTPLMWAIINQHDAEVKLLLEKGSSLNAFDKMKRTPLHHAAAIGRTNTMSLLMHADVEARDSKGRTPLLTSISNGHLEAVRLLLNVGANISVLDEDRKGALHLAIESRHKTDWEMVRLLLAWNAPTDIVDADNMSPFHRIISWHSHSTEIAHRLLERGVDINFGIQRRNWTHTHQERSPVPRLKSEDTTEEPRGLTPLHYAALIGNVKMTKFLLQRGANPNVLSYFGETPLHLALSKTLQGPEYKDIWSDKTCRVKYLWEYIVDSPDMDEEAISEAERTHITAPRRAVIEALLNDERTNFALKRPQDLPILHVVDYKEPESADLIRELIQKGADVSACNMKGHTALHLASLAGHLGCVSKLISEGAAVRTSDNRGRTAIHYAVQSGNIETASCILKAYKGEAHHFLAIKDKNGRTALHCLVSEGFSLSIDMIKPLIADGADVNSTDKAGHSPLAHYLRRSFFLVKAEICQLLLEHGTDTDAIDTAGNNIAQLYASSTSYTINVEVLEVLKKYNVDFERTNSQGRTILHIIALSGSLSLLKPEEPLLFLLKHFNLHLNTEDFSGKTPLEYAVEEAKRKRNPNSFDSGRWLRTAESMQKFAA